MKKSFMGLRLKRLREEQHLTQAALPHMRPMRNQTRMMTPRAMAPSTNNWRLPRD